MSDAIIGDEATWTVTWPWPQTWNVGYYMIAVAEFETNLHIYELVCGSDNIITAIRMQDIGSIYDIKNVDVTGTGSFYVVSVCKETSDPNSIDITTYIRNTNPGEEDPYITELPTSKVPRFLTSCVHKGRIIIGGIDGGDDSNFGDMNLSTVAWSGIGNLDFRIGSDKTAGYRQVPWDDYGGGFIYKILPLGDHVIVYGKSGIIALTPKYVEPVSVYGMKQLQGSGVNSPTLVAGDDTGHCFIDRDNFIWHISPDLEMKKLGYKEYMDALLVNTTDYPVIMSCVSEIRVFYISNGERCFVLTEYGMYETNQLVTSAIFFKGKLCGFFSDTGDYEWRMTTDTIDTGIRGMKTFGMVEVSINHINADSSLNDVFIAADYRYDYQTGQTIFQTTPWVRLNPEGVAFLNITAPEIRLKLKGLDYRNGCINLDNINVRVKLSDKRFVRGMYNAGKNE